MRRTAAVTVLVLLALAGCGGGPDDEGGTTRSPTTSSPTTTADPTVVPTEPGATSAPPEEGEPTTDGTGGGGGNGGRDGGGTAHDSGNPGGDNGGDNGSPGEDERTVELGGPTLDNSFPLDPWALHREGVSSCIILTNALATATVTVRSVELVDQQPPDDPGLALGDDPSTHYQCGPGNWAFGQEELHGDCIDAELEPEERTGCPVVVRSIGEVGTDYTARLLLRLSATCTDLIGQPCSRLTGRFDPTTTDPVIMTWTDERYYSSCLVPREPGAWGESRHGECPPVDASTDSTSPESDPGSDPEPGSDVTSGSDPEPTGDQSPSTEGGDGEDGPATASSAPTATADGGASTP